MEKFIDHPTIKVKISDIEPNDYNPKKSFTTDVFNKARYEEIKQSLVVNGYMDKMTVREKGGKYVIVDGYHRRSAMNELGREGEIQVVCVGKVKEENAMGKTVVMERTNIPKDPIMEARQWKLVSEREKVANIIQRLPGYSVERVQHKIEMIDYRLENIIPLERKKDKEQHKAVRLYIKVGKQELAEELFEHLKKQGIVCKIVIK